MTVSSVPRLVLCRNRHGHTRQSGGRTSPLCQLSRKYWKLLLNGAVRGRAADLTAQSIQARKRQSRTVRSENDQENCGLPRTREVDLSLPVFGTACNTGNLAGKNSTRIPASVAITGLLFLTGRAVFSPPIALDKIPFDVAIG